MSSNDAFFQILAQLEFMVNSMDDDQFTRPSVALGQSTIGQHLRHTLEFFLCLESGYEKGVINYDKRAHDKLIEKDRALALAVIDRVKQFICRLDGNRSLILEVGYDLKNDTSITVNTNVLRELIYNIEHAIHHMAIMKIGIGEVCPSLYLPADFGVAASTIRYNQLPVAQ